MANEPWTFDSPLCSQVGLEPFFEESETVSRASSPREDYQLAIKICNSCAYVAECAEWGIKHEVFGIWGATTPQQRKTIREKRNIIVDVELKTLG